MNGKGGPRYFTVVRKAGISAAFIVLFNLILKIMINSECRFQHWPLIKKHSQLKGDIVLIFILSFPKLRKKLY